jgi:hypothetical protein
MPGDLERRTWQPKDIATRDECHRASLYVASIAAGKDDALQLLGALGLLPARLTVTDHGMSGYRVGCRCPVCRKANRTRNAAQRSRIATTTADAPINTTTGEHP